MTPTVHALHWLLVVVVLLRIVVLVAEARFVVVIVAPDIQQEACQRVAVE
jgi:hypothetical protein